MERYDELGNYLAESGILVFGHDHGEWYVFGRRFMENDNKNNYGVCTSVYMYIELVICYMYMYMYMCFTC